jgi:hypothetical protein
MRIYQTSRSIRPFCIPIFLIGIGAILVLTGGIMMSDNAQATPARMWKVLHIMSYSEDWAWSKEQFAGFKNVLQGLGIEYQVVAMDSKRYSSPER